MMKKRAAAAFSFVLAVCICASVLFSVRVEAAAAPGIFHNDEKWYRDASAGLEVMGSVCYVPVDLFSMFSQIELSMDSRRGEFMLYNRNTGNYISVLYEKKIATVNGKEEIYLAMYRLHGGYFYVPAEFFCSVLSLECETVPSSNASYGLTLRISDGTHTQTMEQLLADYDPVRGTDESSAADTTTETPPVTVRPPVTSGSDTVERCEYLTFNTVGYDCFPEVLDALREAGIKGAFFFTREEMLQYPLYLLTAMIEGHTIGLTCTEAEDAEDFLAQMEEANEVLYSILKIRTRIVQYPGGTGAAGFTGSQLQRLAESGYILWDWTYDVPDSVGYSVSYVDTVCRRAVEREQVNVLRMSCNPTVADFLPDFLSYLQAAGNHTVQKIHAVLDAVCFVSLDKE